MKMSQAIEKYMEQVNNLAALSDRVKLVPLNEWAEVVEVIEGNADTWPDKKFLAQFERDEDCGWSKHKNADLMLFTHGACRGNWFSGDCAALAVAEGTDEDPGSILKNILDKTSTSDFKLVLLKASTPASAKYLWETSKEKKSSKSNEKIKLFDCHYILILNELFKILAECDDTDEIPLDLPIASIPIEDIKSLENALGMDYLKNEVPRLCEILFFYSGNTVFPGCVELEEKLANCTPFIQNVVHHYIAELSRCQELKLNFEINTLNGKVKEYDVGFPSTCFDIYIDTDSILFSIILPLSKANKLIGYERGKQVNQLFFSLDEKKKKTEDFLLDDIKKSVGRFPSTIDDSKHAQYIIMQMHDILRSIFKNDNIFLFILALLAYRKKYGPTVSPENITIKDICLHIREIVKGDYITQIFFGNSSLQQTNVISQCFEIIASSGVSVKELSEALLSTYDNRSKWSGCGSPKLICEIIPGLLHPAMHDRIFSPTFGFGQLERSMIQYAISHSHRELIIDAIEINSDVVLAGKLFNYINEYNKINIVAADMFSHRVQPAHYDIAICTPPFGLRVNTNQFERLELIDVNPFQVLDLVNMKSISAEEYSLLKGYFALNEKGRMAIVVSNGLFMRNEFQHTLRILLERDHLEAVIELPSKIYSFTNIPSTLIIINKTKNELKTNKFIYIYPDKVDFSVDNIISAFDVFQEIDNFSQIIKVDALLQQEAVNIKQYINKEKHSGNNLNYIRLKDIVRIEAGKNYKTQDIVSFAGKQTDFIEENLVRLVRPSDITENKIDFSLDLSRSNNFVPIDKTTKVISTRCLLLTKIGTKLKPVIFCPINENDRITINQHIFALYPIDQINIDYLCMLFIKDEQIIKQVDSLRAGTAIPMLTKAALELIFINKINLSEQQDALKKYRDALLKEEHVRHNQIVNKLQEELEANDYEIAGAIAHNINNKLFPLSGSAASIKKFLDKRGLLSELIQEPLDDDEQVETVEECINRCIQQCESISQLIRNAKSVLTEKINVNDYKKIDLVAACNEFMNNHRNSEYLIKVYGKKAIINLHKISFMEAMECMLKNAIVHAWNIDGMTSDQKVFRLTIEPNEQDETVKLICYNSGRPFPKDYSLKEYQKFMSKSTKSPGSGIGGAWVKKFLNAHNANLEINRFSDDLDKQSGTAFVISFNNLILE